jgi:RNA polymerase sigma-70 factor (ECF subfamily)
VGIDQTVDASVDAVAAIEMATATARAAWDFATPALDAQFAAHVRALVIDDPDAAAIVGKLHAADVYLAVACAAGVAGALSTLDREYLAGLRPALGRMGLSASGIDETFATMREELLSPRPSAPARILGYSGRGQLRGWLRAVAARTGLRVGLPRLDHDELDGNQPGGGADLELAYMKKLYGDSFKRAFAAALAALPADQRLLLKERFRHKLTVEELGALHQVNPGTISRWVAAAREQLVKATRTEMMRELGVGKADVSSILRLIQSELEITLSTTT